MTSKRAKAAIEANTLIYNLREAQLDSENLQIEDSISGLLKLFEGAGDADEAGPRPAVDHLIEETNSAYHALSHSRMVLRYQHALSRDGISAPQFRAIGTSMLNAGWLTCVPRVVLEQC